MNEDAVIDNVTISLYLKYQSNETSRQCPEVPTSDGKNSGQIVRLLAKLESEIQKQQL